MNEPSRLRIERFLHQYIETVPHLEALLLLWNARPQAWSAVNIAERLFIRPDVVRKILQDLLRMKLAAIDRLADTYRYAADPQRDVIMLLMEAAYREDLVGVSQFIHRRESAARHPAELHHSPPKL